MYMSSLPKRCCRLLRSRSGSQYVEAAITLPVIILTAMLLLRVFTFYLEILSTGVAEHAKALEAWDEYSGTLMRKYSEEKDVVMLRGGILHMDLTKKIHTETHLINEDVLVRAGDAVG